MHTEHMPAEGYPLGGRNTVNNNDCDYCGGVAVAQIGSDDSDIGYSQVCKNHLPKRFAADVTLATWRAGLGWVRYGEVR
mgnify:CR=1 FL=1